MTIPKDTVYPALATNTEWQKKKSFKDKMKAATKTGLGAKLKTAEQAWDAIKWQYLSEVDLHPRPQTAAQAQSNLNRATLAMHQVETTKHAVTEARNAALQAANNAELTQNAQTYATSIAAALLKASNRLAQVKIDDFEGQYETLAEHEEEQAKLRRKLTNVRVYRGQQQLFTAAKAKRVSDNRVEIEQAQWAEDGDKLNMVNVKVTVRAAQGDNSNFQHDLKIAELTRDGRKVILTD